ncbi:serine hydrolase [Altererythrobacter endophyticus]|uniref:Serine hydrolase n=2 Tax=Altericroceibacterium endophyticum TaxID=1808508 RepID=A0A6I4T8B5_9SPHN|nr:serine hydrolase [Altericroceibacterium endophyticum]
MLVMMLCLALLSVMVLAVQAPAQSVRQGSGPAEATQAPSNSQTPDSAPSDSTAIAPLDPADVEAWLDGFFPYALERGRIAGAVVVVVQGDQAILSKGYGYSDVESQRRVDPQTTMFRPGSVSKLLTWTAVMQQVEAGKLDLDRDVNDYLDFKIPPYEGKPITLRQIMTHSAGFEESMRHLISADPAAAMDLGDLVKEALPQRVFAPGTTPAYSNYATALAGYIVQRVSGVPFDDYIDQRIFTPLKMNHSTFRQPLPKRFERFMSKGYSTSTEAAKPYEIVIPGPAGALASSGADMGRFMIAHLQGGGPLLSAETTRQMHDFRAPALGPLNTMALGFYEQRVNGRRAIAHGGDTEWFHSDLWLFPEEGVGVYVSLNSNGINAAPHAIRGALLHKFADRYLPGEDSYTPIDEQTARQHAALVAGHYVSSRGAFTNFMSVLNLLSPTEVIATPDGTISIPALDAIASGPREWIEVEPYVWRDRETGERVAAEVKDGKVTRLSMDVMSPFTVLQPASFGENPAWLLPALFAALAIVLLAALAWPIRALVRRHYGSEFPLQGTHRLVYRLTRVFAWLILAALACWIILITTFMGDIGAIGGPLDDMIMLVRILCPLASIGLTITAAYHLFLSFRDGRAWTMKLGALLLLLAGLVFLWVTFRFHIYGFGMVY